MFNYPEKHKVYIRLFTQTNKMLVGIYTYMMYIIFNTHIRAYHVGLCLVTASELLVICGTK